MQAKSGRYYRETRFYRYVSSENSTPPGFETPFLGVRLRVIHKPTAKHQYSEERFCDNALILCFYKYQTISQYSRYLTQRRYFKPNLKQF